MRKMEKLKYTIDDTMVMANAFSTLTRECVTEEEMKEKILSICNYPVDAVEKFITAVNAVSERAINPENRFGILAYITLRINLFGNICAKLFYWHSAEKSGKGNRAREKKHCLI